MKRRIIAVICLMLFLFPLLASAQDGDVNIVVGTIERPPFVFVNEDGDFEGFSIDLWEQLARDLGIPFEYQLETEFSVMMEKVANGEVELAVANISITREREQVMDFSHPIFDAGLQIMIPQQNAISNLAQAVFNSGVIPLLLISGLVLLVAGHVIWWFERGRHRFFSREYKSGVWNGIWYVYITLIMGGFEDNPPSTRGGRIFAIGWTLSSLFLVSIFTAQITTALTVGQLQSDISGPDDLFGKSVGVINGSTSHDYVMSANINPRTYDTLDRLFADLEAQRLEAVIHDAPIVQFYAANDGKGQVEVVEGIFQPEKFGIAIHQDAEDAELREQINQQLLQYQEDGTYQTFYNRWFGD